MGNNIVLYNQVAAFIGPAPSSGYHFIDLYGTLINSDNPSGFNLVFPLNRIFNVTYGFTENRSNVKSIGHYGTIAKQQFLPPNVDLSFSYYIMGAINDLRLGLIVNHPTGFTENDPPLYGSDNINPLSGFLDRTYQPTNLSDISWPLTYRDSHNIFIATKQTPGDLNDYNTGIYKSTDVDVLALGDCYLTNYKITAGVNNLPQVTVDFISSNIEVYNYASGKSIPSINPKTFIPRTGIYYNLPNNFQGNNLPTVVIPSDASITIANIPSGDYLATESGDILIIDYDGGKLIINQDDDPDNLPINIEDVKLQDFTINLPINREPLYNLGYISPIDRRINFPIFANIDFSAIVGQSATGSLSKLFIKDRNYDIIVKLNYQRSQSFSGVAMMYKLLGAKLNNMSFQDSIGTYRTARFSFLTELKPNITDRGLFMSGQLGLRPLRSGVADVFLEGTTGDGSTFLLATEDGYLLAIGYKNINMPLY